MEICSSTIIIRKSLRYYSGIRADLGVMKGLYQIGLAFARELTISGGLYA